MKNCSLLLTFLLLSATCNLFAQEKEGVYSLIPGKINSHETTMTEYAPDPDAEAVVIYDLGDYFFQGDHNKGTFILHKNRQIKIKILKQAGINYSNFEIPLYHERHESDDLVINSAVVYNFENNSLRKTVLDPKRIFEEKINNHWSAKRFTMPDVKEGSIIELDYSIVTPFYFNMGIWEFQRTIPVIYNRLNFRAIPYFTFTYILKGDKNFDDFQSRRLNREIRFGNLKYEEMEYTFVKREIPAFKDEEFISARKDYMVAMDFQISKIFFPQGGSKDIMSTWPEMCRDFLNYQDFGKYMKSSEKEAKKILPTLSLEGISPLEQVRTITGYVKSMYNWNGSYGKFASEKLSDFLNKKTGNSGNINLFLAGLLKAQKLNATPLILSTRKNGAISLAHPFESFFNYVIVRVEIDGESYFLDATEPMLRFDEIPERCTNVRALVVKPGSEEFVITYQKEPVIEEKEIRITPLSGEEKRMEAAITLSGRGNAAYNLRRIYLGKDENLLNYLKVRYGVEAEAGSLAVREQDDQFSFSFRYVAGEGVVPEKIFIPLFANMALKENPFRQTIRTLPVDMVFLKGESYRSVIEIPEGYKVEYLPEVVEVKNEIVDYHLKVTQKERQIEIEAGYNLRKNMYEASEYPLLKDLFSEIVEKYNEAVILTKMM